MRAKPDRMYKLANGRYYWHLRYDRRTGRVIGLMRKNGELEVVEEFFDLSKAVLIDKGKEPWQP